MLSNSTSFRQRDLGFTLVEIMVTLVVLAVLLAAIVPNLRGFSANQRLTDAAEQVHVQLQLARSEAMARSVPVFVNFADTGDSAWTYGISMTAGCTVTEVDPTAAGACVLVRDDGDGNIDPGDGSVDGEDLILHRRVGADHVDVTMAIANFASGNTEIRFDPIRGIADSGDIQLTASTGRRLTIRLSALGTSRICTPDGSVGGYSDANCG